MTLIKAMSTAEKQITNPFSSGGGGVIFETHVQALFVVLMLAGGFVPFFPSCVINKIKLQGRYAGYDTDDLIVYVEGQGNGEEKKLLGQVKHSITITERDVVFGEVIEAAWNDFNDPRIFTRGRDCIALITGPLSATDTDNVREILEWARSCENSGEFFTKVELANFSSKAKQQKLNAFRSQLKEANGGQEVSDEEIFQFLTHFHLLGYDLDSRDGVALSLLHSLIGQYSQTDAHNIWARVIDEVQSANRSAGTITIDTLPHDICAVFQRPHARTMPSELAVTPSQIIDWSQTQYASELAVANLLGSWNEKSEADRVLVSKLTNDSFDKWIPKIRESLQQPGSPISLRNGIWNVTERKELWQAVGQRLFDSNLDSFKVSVVAVLTECDPRFDLPPEERYAASVRGKVLYHSQYLRKGLAESLALLGSFPTALSNCSTDKPQTIALLSVREIFCSSDWVLWGSLNNLLPLLAEASPNEFLNVVETALEQAPCPFDALFAQEGKGILGENYLTGLLWALETLAWDEQYLVRVAVILGNLTSHDPGGSWANRPSNSLKTIFLPWFPQTFAPIEKRKVAIQTLQRENPEAAWKLLLSLLPGPLQSSSGCSKPRWRMTIPEDWPKDVTRKEYEDQVTSYVDMTIEMAEHDVNRLEGLANHLDHLPAQSLEKLLKHLSAEDIAGKPENERMPLWTGLTELVSRHERFAGAQWALNPDLVSRIKEIANKLAPQDRLNLSRRLFAERDMDLFEERGNWQEQRKKLEDRRQLAIKAILDIEGSSAVLRFADMVESPWKAGVSLGFVADSEMDSIVLPNLLEAENKNLLELASGFVCGRFVSRGWVWVDGTDMTCWSHSQIGQFLSYLPFTADTWKRSEEALREFEAIYWRKVSVNPHQAEGELHVAIDKLLESGRPNAAIQCLYSLYEQQLLDKARTVRALRSALSSTEPPQVMNTYYIVRIIKALQDDPNTNPGDLAFVEWAYLPLLEGDHGVLPKTLENRLASDPGFFCEVIRSVYRSKKEHKSEKERTEQEVAVAENAYRLLHKWQTPPGMQPDDSISKEHLVRWLESVKAACNKSGHLEVALTHVGQVLFRCAPDPSGQLWIDCAAAEVLNATDADKIRHGFALAIFNSRGIHVVDPSGKPELDLSAKYRKQAEEAENAGYQRLAVTMREVADFYTREANRIIEAHDNEGASDS